MNQAATQQRDPIDALVKAVESPNLKVQIVRALPKQLDIERFMRIGMTLIRKTPSIQRCETLSIISSIVEASQLGLELDPVLGHGYLIPRKSKKMSEELNRTVFLCTFMPGYKGFVHLMRNSGLVTNVNAELVFRDEEFRVELGTERRIIHNPDYEAKGRTSVWSKEEGRHYDETNWRGAYATVAFTNGTSDFEFLPASEINERRARSDAKDNGPWVTDTPAMWKKTAIRAISKRQPLSPQNRELVRAATLDEMRDDETYREREPIAPALELPQETIEVTGAQPEETQAAQTAEKTDKKDRIRRKSEKAQPTEEGKANVPKAQMPPKEDAAPLVELVSAGAVRNLTKFALEEKGLSRERFINILGSHGYEKPEEIAKKDYTKIWEDVGNAKK